MGKPPDYSDVTLRIPLKDLLGGRTREQDRVGAAVTCLTEPKIGFVYRLRRGTTIIGRGEDADLQLTARGVSRRHASITEHDGTYTLEDLGSTNGTFCRGQRLTGPLALKDRDAICVGPSVMLKFAFHDELEERMGTELYERATRDPLTEARNRRHFRDRLDSEWPWARRHQRACAILMLDLDHFKRINDGWGHPAGDLVLREFARVIRAQLRKEDLFGRIGGEEFAVLCRATEARDAATLAERLRASVAAHEFVWESTRLPVTVSIGISTSAEPDIETIEALMKRADERLYEAKRNGRNRVVGAEPRTPSAPEPGH